MSDKRIITNYKLDDIGNVKVDMRWATEKERFLIIEELLKHKNNFNDFVGYCKDLNFFLDTHLAEAPFWYVGDSVAGKTKTIYYGRCEESFEKEDAEEVVFTAVVSFDELVVSEDEDETEEAPSEKGVDLQIVLKYLRKQYGEEDANLFLHTLKHLED